MARGMSSRCGGQDRESPRVLGRSGAPSEEALVRVEVTDRLDPALRKRRHPVADSLTPLRALNTKDGCDVPKLSIVVLGSRVAVVETDLMVPLVHHLVQKYPKSHVRPLPECVRADDQVTEHDVALVPLGSAEVPNLPTVRKLYRDHDVWTKRPAEGG